MCPQLRCVGVLGRESTSDAAPFCCEGLIERNWGAEMRFEQGSEGMALICFTSGTTGSPKAVVVSHRALHSQSLVKLAVCSYKFSDTYLHTAPLFHIGGMSSGLAMLMAGAKHVFFPKFSAKEVVRLVHAHNVTALIAVPAMIEDLRLQKRTMTSIETVLVGGGGMTKSQMVR